MIFITSGHLWRMTAFAKTGKLFYPKCSIHIALMWLNLYVRLFDLSSNKPERVFGLQVRCRELDIFKIRNFLRNCLDFFGILLEDFFGILLEDFFGRIFLEGFSWEKFFLYIVYLNLKGIDPFVKILSESRRKEEI